MSDIVGAIREHSGTGPRCVRTIGRAFNSLRGIVRTRPRCISSSLLAEVIRPSELVAFEVT